MPPEEQAFRTLIDAVAARMGRPVLWRWLAAGLLVAGTLGILLAAARLLGAWDILRWIALGCVVVIPVACLVLAATKKIERLRAVRAIDSHYALKSRALTLWSYFEAGHLNDAQRLAVAEAWPQVQSADPVRIVPVHVPKTVYPGGLLVVLAVVLCLLSPFDFSRVEQVQEDPLPITDGAEMTVLAPLPKLDPESADGSPPTVLSGDSAEPTTQTFAPPPGSGKVISDYFRPADPTPR